MKKPASFHAVPVLLLFLSIGAWYGAISMLMSTDGSALGMSSEMLANSPFRTYLIPALLLLVFFGILPAIAAWGWWCKGCFPQLEKLNIYREFRWPFFFALVCGFGQIVWIAAQQIMLGYAGIQTIYTALGIAICVTALLPYSLSEMRKS